jgi:hypothetical protein
MRESIFTKKTKDMFSGKTPEQVDALQDPNLEYDTAQLEKMAGPLERAMGDSVREMVKKGKDNPEWYERTAVHFEQRTNEPILSLVYSGLDNPDTVDTTPSQRPTWADAFAAESVAGKIGVAAMKAISGPHLPDMYPTQGLRCTFRGPAARAAFSAEQLNRVHQAMLDRTKEIVESFIEQHGPDAKVRVWGISAGTLGAISAMSMIGDLLGHPIDKCTVISPGLSMGLGTFAAWPVSPAADSLREAGYTPQSFHEATKETSQEWALRKGKHNVRGRDFNILSATHDTIVPNGLPGGSRDFVKLARELGLAPNVVEYKGLDHVTMPGEILWQIAYGNDPTFERDRASLWSIPETYKDANCIRKLDEILSRFSEEELPFFAEEVSRRNGTTGEADMDPYTRALARRLLDREICMVMVGPRYLYVRNKENLIDKVDPSEKKSRERVVRTEYPRIIRELRALDHDENFKPLYEMTVDEKKLKSVDARAS